MIDLTPQRMKCGGSSSSCPSVHRLEDGRLEITGEYVRIIPGISGHDEATIRIDLDLLENVWCQAGDSVKGEAPSEPSVPLQSSLAAEVEKKITVEELGEIFGEMIPMEAVDVLINPLASVRKHLREIAAKSKRPTEEAGTADERTARFFEGFRKTPVTVGTAKEEIEAHMGELVDLLSVFIEVDINPHAWNQLLIYAPRSTPD